MYCTGCAAEVHSGFCQNCGTRVVQAAAPAHAAPAAATRSANGLVATDVPLRAAGYLLDVIPAAILSLIAWIPIIGGVIAGFLLLSYWLLRDCAGGSLGKMLLGLRVVQKDGSPSTPGQRILRNLPLAIGPGMLILPVVGYFIAAPTSAILFLTEAILLLAKKERLGDMIAGTTVIKKPG